MFGIRHKFMAASNGEGGEGGGGLPDAGKTEAGTPDAGKPDAGKGGGANTPDVAAELAALRATVEALTAAKTEADAAKTEAETAAEAARVAGLSAAEKLSEDRAAFAAEVEAGKAGIRKEARAQSLDKLGVLPAYRDWAPDVDPRTAEGAAAIEEWAKIHPEVVKQASGAPVPYTPAPTSKIGQVLSGAVKNPFMSAAGLRKLLN